MRGTYKRFNKGPGRRNVPESGLGFVDLKPAIASHSFWRILKIVEHTGCSKVFVTGKRRKGRASARDCRRRGYGCYNCLVTREMSIHVCGPYSGLCVFCRVKVQWNSTN
jgi:hypothetical protein